MSISRRRVRAIERKELREYRRSGSIVATMVLLPLIFLIQPLIVVFALPASAAPGLSHDHLLLYMLGIPALVPATLAAYSVVGERQQARWSRCSPRRSPARSSFWPRRWQRSSPRLSSRMRSMPSSWSAL